MGLSVKTHPIRRCAAPELASTITLRLIDQDPPLVGMDWEVQMREKIVFPLPGGPTPSRPRSLR